MPHECLKQNTKPNDPPQPKLEGRDARHQRMPAAPPPTETADQDVFRALVKRANSGDRDALVRLRQVLDEHPEIWDEVGDLAAHAEAAFIAAIAGGDQLLAESLQRKSEDLKQSLTRPGASMAEKLAAQRVVACWLQLQHADTMCSHFSRSEPPEPSAEPTPKRGREPRQPAEKPMPSLREATFWAKRQNQAARQYEAAMKLLLIVQQLQPGGAIREDARRTGAAHDGRGRNTEVA